MNKGFFTDVLASRPLLWEAMLRANSRPASASEGFPDASALPGEAAAARRSWLGRGPAGAPPGPRGPPPPGLSPQTAPPGGAPPPRPYKVQRK